MKNEWLWTYYKKQGWVNDEGQKLYCGRHQKELENHSRVVIRTVFWARRPTLAMREIARRFSSGEEVPDGSIIN